VGKDNPSLGRDFIMIKINNINIISNQQYDNLYNSILDLGRGPAPRAPKI
jgi:hypothetical protein